MGSSNMPLHVFTYGACEMSEWMDSITVRSRRPVAVVDLFKNGNVRAPFFVPYYMDFGNLALWIHCEVKLNFDLYEFVEQAKDDKFRAVYLLDGKQDVMLFRNKYCERLTPEYVLTAPIEELQSLKWAGAKENVGTLTLKPVEV